MEKNDYRQYETKQNDMKLIMEFNKKSNNESGFIKEEIREILSNVLQEYLTKFSCSTKGS